MNSTAFVWWPDFGILLVFGKQPRNSVDKYRKLIHVCQIYTLSPDILVSHLKNNLCMQAISHQSNILRNAHGRAQNTREN